MSGQDDARYLSRRWPESAEETPSDREPAEEFVSEVTETPIDPKSTTRYRAALGAVIGLGVLIVVALVIMVVGLAKGWGTQAPAQAAAKKPVMWTLAPGFRILSNDTQPGRLILHVRSETVDEIDIIDLEDGRIITQIHAEPPK